MRDDGGVADNARRIVQEMIVNEKVGLDRHRNHADVAGHRAAGDRSQNPTLVMSSGASVTVTKSPYMVRAGFLQSQQAWIMAEWAAKNGSKRVVTLVNDWAPGIESETAFKTRFLQAGGEIIESIRIPLANPDFAPFLQRIRDHQSGHRVHLFPGHAGEHLRQAIRRAGAWQFRHQDHRPGRPHRRRRSQHHGRPDARHHHVRFLFRRPRFRRSTRPMSPAFEKANGFRPDFVSVGAYDGLHLIYEALKKTNGNADGDVLLAAMKGMAWESPRGPISIDPETRDIVQNIYIRKVEKVNGQLYSMEFATYEAVKDPMKAGGK